MIMGYSVDHLDDAFQALNLESKKIIDSRYVIWLGKNFQIWSKSSLHLLNENYEVDHDNDDFITKAKELNEVNHDIEINQEPVFSERTKDKLYCQLNQKLQKYLARKGGPFGSS